MAEPIEMHVGEVDFPYRKIRQIEATSDKRNIDEVNSRLRSQAALLGANAIVEVVYSEAMTLGSFSAMRGVGWAVQRQSDEVACPSCAEKIKRAAVRCRFCGHEVGLQVATQEVHAPEGASAEMMDGAASAPQSSHWRGIVGAVAAFVVVAFIVSSFSGNNRETSAPPTTTAPVVGQQTQRDESSVRFMGDPRTDAPSAATVAPSPPPPPPSPWDYTSRHDQMSDTSVHHACTTSTNQIRLDFPYESQSVVLCVRQHPRWGQDVIVRLTQGGQFICRSYMNCIVRVRFDDHEASGYSANEPDDGSSDVIFISNDARFVSNLRQSDRVIIEAEFYQSGAQQMTFSTRDLEWPRP